MTVARQCVVCGSHNLVKVSAVLAPFLADRIFDWKPMDIDESFGFRDIPIGHAYALCNTLCCSECQMLFLDMRFDDDEMGRLYSGYRDENYTELRSSYESGYEIVNQVLEGKRWDYVRQVELFLQPHLSGDMRILDFGGDDGANTPFIDTADTVHIFDISGKTTLHNAVAVTIDEIKKYQCEYSLVTCMQVLEHVSDPHQIIQQLVDLSGKRTLIYLEIPLETLMVNPMEKFYTKKRLWHEHINFFSPMALERLAVIHDLVIVDKFQTEVGNGKQIQAIVCRKK
ncbi:MAG: class I SAM-dependent methyltransferase [Pseudomonadota bacterium]